MKEGLEGYQDKKGGDKSIIVFKVENLEQGIRILESRLGGEDKESVKNSIEIQIEIKKQEIRELREKLEKLKREDIVGNA